MEELAATIVDSAGQPATVRVGTVTSVNPLGISLGGAPMNMEAVGVIGSGFAIGGPALLLGQSVKGGSSSGSSWVALGAPADSGASDILRRGLTQLVELSASAPVSIVAASTAVPGCSATVTTRASNAVFEAIVFCDLTVSGATGTVVAELTVDGATHPEQVILGASANLRVTAGQTFGDTLTSPGDHTFSLSVRNASGLSSGTLSATHTTMKIKVFE